MHSTGDKGNTTKQKILEVAIDLFADKGFDKVTIREIAKEVGIKGSSIYNHFQSKNHILEAILTYHKSRLNQTYHHEDIDEDNEKGSQDISLETILLDLMEKSFKGLQSPILLKILKILSQEQLKNDTIRHYFYNDYILKARKTLKMHFDRLVEKGLIHYHDTEFLANEFHAYIIYKYYENVLLKQHYNMDLNQLKKDVLKYIAFFYRTIGS